MFQGFPEIKEALMSNKMQAAFMVAPMAIALRAQGVPVKIVYLGHRYGSAVVVRSDGNIRRVPDLRGKVIAIPSRFSDERLIVFKALKDNGMSGKDVHLVEMAPPDVPGALSRAKGTWPAHFPGLVGGRRDGTGGRPAAGQALVGGIARSGLWLEDGARRRCSRPSPPWGGKAPGRTSPSPPARGMAPPWR